MCVCVCVCLNRVLGYCTIGMSGACDRFLSDVGKHQLCMAGGGALYAAAMLAVLKIGDKKLGGKGQEIAQHFAMAAAANLLDAVVAAGGGAPTCKIIVDFTLRMALAKITIPATQSMNYLVTDVSF